jgi:hypothetical protein
LKLMSRLLYYTLLPLPRTPLYQPMHERALSNAPGCMEPPVKWSLNR